MGFNTTIIVYNDALDAISRDPNFGKSLSDAISELAYGKPVNVPSLNHANAAVAIETHHADETAIVAVGQNYGSKLAGLWYLSNNDTERKFQIARHFAEQCGYKLVPLDAKTINQVD